MDTLTHSLVGVALSRAGFQGRVPYATAALVIAANLPDVDCVFGWNNVSFLAHHRGLTHSLAAWPVWAILVALGLRWAARRRALRAAAPRARGAPALATAGGGPAVRNLPVDDWAGDAPSGRAAAGGARLAALPGWGICLLLGAVGVGSHLLLDWSNQYGIRLLAPFSQHWFALNIEPLVDPWIWVLLLFFLLAPMVLGLVGGEIGVRQKPHRFSAVLVLALIVAWGGWRAFNHARALGWLQSQTFSGAAPLHVAAFPETGTARQWRAVVDLPDRYELADLDAGDLRITNLAPQTLFKPALSPAIQLAESTHAGQAFLRFARFPLALVGRGADGGTVVLFTDLRYKAAFQPVEVGLLVHEDSRLRVTSAHFQWRGAGARLPGAEEGQ